MIVVTRENGSSRDPYPPTTVSLLTNPRSDFRSARTTRIGHLNLTTDESATAESALGSCGKRGRRTRYEDCVKRPGDREEIDVKERDEREGHCGTTPTSRGVVKSAKRGRQRRCALPVTHPE